MKTLKQGNYKLGSKQIYLQKNNLGYLTAVR